MPQGDPRSGPGGRRPRSGDGGKCGATSDHAGHGPKIRQDRPRADQDRRRRLSPRTSPGIGPARRGRGGRSPHNGIEGRSTQNPCRRLGREIGHARRSQFCSELADGVSANQHATGVYPDIRNTKTIVINRHVSSIRPHDRLAASTKTLGVGLGVGYPTLKREGSPMGRLTAAAVRAAKHPSNSQRPIRIGDGGGLYLQVAAGDTKSGCCATPCAASHGRWVWDRSASRLPAYHSPRPAR